MNSIYLLVCTLPESRGRFYVTIEAAQDVTDVELAIRRRYPAVHIRLQTSYYVPLGGELDDGALQER